MIELQGSDSRANPPKKTPIAATADLSTALEATSRGITMQRLVPSLLRQNSVRRGVVRTFVSQSDTDYVPVESRSFKYITVSHEDRVATIELNRPKALNALNRPLVSELLTAAEAFDADPSVHAIVISGNSRAFAAGSDIPEMADSSYRSARFKHDFGGWMTRISQLRKPVVAAVSGFALGGGCELALAADVIIADEDATFGLPEIALGTHPGLGGTQRLVRATGKAKAMEMILTGRHMPAAEAESAGLVSRLAPKGKAMDEAKDVAAVIARHSLPVLIAAKECVNAAAEMPLSQGILFEKRSFQSTFALNDQKEGMKAFIDKRKPVFQNK